MSQRPTGPTVAVGYNLLPVVGQWANHKRGLLIWMRQNGTQNALLFQREAWESKCSSLLTFFMLKPQIYIFMDIKKTEKCQIWDLQRKPHNNYNSNNTFEDKITKCNNVGPLHLSPECCGHWFWVMSNVDSVNSIKNEWFWENQLWNTRDVKCFHFADTLLAFQTFHQSWN